MKLTLSGSVHFANGDPLSNVVVRIFDRDAEGKQDDDLTVSEGVSDADGHFRLAYEPLRYLDYHTIQLTDTTNEPFNTPNTELQLRLPDLGDLYMPYLKFSYEINGIPHEYEASMGFFKSEYRLPENPPIDFRPSTNGFKFINRFPGYYLPFSTPAFMGSSKVSTQYGLCGGMCAAAYDYALAGREIPDNAEVPHQGSRLQHYLFRRQNDSLGGIGQQILKVAQWTTLPDDTLLGVQRRTMDEFERFRGKLEVRNPVILALIYERAANIGELAKIIFNNHQVLAYAYHQEMTGDIVLEVYDPNLPGRDDVTIQVKPVQLGAVNAPSGPQPVQGFESAQWLGAEFYRQVRGFFAMPYHPTLPPKR